MKLSSLLKKAAVLASIVICCWCIVIKIQSWAKENGTAAIMTVAGITEQETSSPQSRELTNEDDDIHSGFTLLEDDEMVPFNENEIPATQATPDPDREYNNVLEIQATGGTAVDCFYVKDSTGSGLNLEQELLVDPAIDIKANGEVEVLLYHTHTSEAFMDSYTGFFYTDMATRSLNTDENVVAVGEEIRQKLEAAGIGVVHDTSVNDTIFNGSYARSWEVIQNNLKQYPTIQVTIDIHRDSMTNSNGEKYKPTAEINGRKAAQIMIITGCNANGTWNNFPNWKDNLHLALRLQQKASQLYPNLMRPLNFANKKYNMNATTGSLLIEVGTEVNTISEVKYSGQLIGDALVQALTS